MAVGNGAIETSISSHAYSHAVSNVPSKKTITLDLFKLLIAACLLKQCKEARVCVCVLYASWLAKFLKLLCLSMALPEELHDACTSSDPLSLLEGMLSKAVLL